MTSEQFDKLAFGPGTIAVYIPENKMYAVSEVSFSERLFGLRDIEIKDGYIFWVRCENVILA